MLGLLFSLFVAGLSLMFQMMVWSLRMTLFLFTALLQVAKSSTAESRR